MLHENGAGRNILIFTNSDQIARLNELAEALPEFRFHVAALTEMSSKLLAVSVCPNISLFPAISEKKAASLWKTCDIYLDINYGNEILSAVKTAFQNRHLIFAFEETAHNRQFVAAKNIFRSDHYKEMAGRIRTSVSDKAVMENELKVQFEAAFAASPEDYKRVISGADRITPHSH